MFASIAVNVPTVMGSFDYRIPPELTARVSAGQLVTVPFGKQTVQGVILCFIDTPSVAEPKSIIETLDPQPVLTSAQIALAEELAQSTLSPIGAIVGLMLPPGLSQQGDVLYEIRTVDGGRWTIDDGLRSTVHGQGTVSSRLIKLLEERGSLRGRQIDRCFGPVDWRKTAQYLVRRGVLSSQSVLPAPRVRPKFVRTAQLAVAPEAAEAAMGDLGKTEATQKRRGAALKFLLRATDAVNVSWVYAESGCNIADLQELAERELILLRETEIWRDPLEKTGTQVGTYTSRRGEIDLTPEQESAFEQIRQALLSLATRHSFLLHGVTGSGKTEIYLRAVDEVVKRGRQAIILVPEIALTPQTVRRFLERFPGQVGLVHSKLSEGERYDTWRRARMGLLKVVIGARSALFTPLPNIGLIVADECHDSSYYQSEPPFYHAVTAAQMCARIAGAVCIFGSATPSVSQRYQTEVGESVRLELPRRVPNAGLTGSALGLPPVSIIDMREELKAGNRSIFSRELTEALGQTLARGEQAILFLNRRGTATYIFCRDCGHVLKCPNCDTPLTLHVEKLEGLQVGRLLCHRCGYERQKPKTCPVCGKTNIREYGLGSERVEADVNALFPKARTLRWDWETTRQKDAHEIILTHFASHRADVLVGTQMLAKGLDLPLVTLVGIVLADVGLYLPDPFAAERVFQVLTQVAGRAGRSERGGKVLLQTFDSENRVIQFASRHDYAGFYANELEQRKRLGYPPFARLVRLEFRHREAEKADVEAKKLAKQIEGLLAAGDRQQTTMIGPVPCFFAKQDSQYRWQIVLRGARPVELLRGLRLDGWRVEVEPVSLL
ncbi:MAG: primosomal protein N' [Chloroflexi bacterium]|nr:primosomal protein N' [Chloroflexota bacterium]